MKLLPTNRELILISISILLAILVFAIDQANASEPNHYMGSPLKSETDTGNLPVHSIIRAGDESRGVVQCNGDARFVIEDLGLTKMFWRCDPIDAKPSPTPTQVENGV